MSIITTHGYIRTHSGLKFYPFSPQPEQICIEDIAAGLSKTCRYSGQIPVFYSVAEHSLDCAKLVPDEFKLSALLHDASEAYLADIPKPIKELLPDYQALERTVTKAIDDTFRVDSGAPIVKQADRTMLLLEFSKFFPEYVCQDFGRDVRPYADIIPKWFAGLFPEIAEVEFLRAFVEYSRIK